MLIYCILLYSLLYRNGNAAPTGSSVDPSALLIRETSVTDACPRKRIEIIWACIATILASSWVAVHPNLPHPDDSKFKKILRRVELMFWAIITPELIIYWAARQWYGARWMEKYFRGEIENKSIWDLPTIDRRAPLQARKSGIEYLLAKFYSKASTEKPSTKQGFKWTTTHGFFLQMGGFMVHEKGQEKRVLTLRKLADYYEEGRINLSGVTEARINDHSKADGFAKGIALLQTSWFIVQCIARFSDRDLILTELELVTAALAVLSLVMYALWWNKPFNAEIPIVLTVSDTPHTFKNDGSDDRDKLGKPFFEELTDAICQCKHIFSRIKEFLTDTGASEWSNFKIVRIYNDMLAETATNVPTFFSIPAYAPLDDLKLRLPCFSIAALFGAIHCAGWSTKIHFSSHAASLLWRISSGVITASPVIWSLYFVLDYARLVETSTILFLSAIFLRNPVKFLSIFTIPLYILSRFILLVLAFVELRDVPPGALATIKWVNVLPFIH